MELKDKYEQLWILMGAYFHEDFEGLREPADEYLEETLIEDVRVLIADIDVLLETTPPDALFPTLRALGSYVWLGDEPGKYVEWLTEIRQAAVARIQAAESQGNA